MMRFLALFLLLSLPQILVAEADYVGSYLYCYPLASGNLIIREMKVPSIPQALRGAVGGGEMELYLVKHDKSIPLFDRAGQDLVPNPFLPVIQEEKAPSRIGLLLYDQRNPMPPWLEVFQTDPGGATESVSRIQFPDLRGVVSSVTPCCYVASMNAWAFDLWRRPAATQSTTLLERRELRLVRADGEVLSRGFYSLPGDEFGFGLQGVLIDKSESHIALVIAETKGDDGDGSRIRAVTFDLSDLSKSPTDQYLTDESSEPENPWPYVSRDNRYMAILPNNPAIKRPLVSVWTLMAGRVKRIAAPSPIPDLPGARTERRVQWSTPGNRLVFANCNKETLHLVIMDAHLKVLGRRSVAGCAGRGERQDQSENTGVSWSGR